MMSFFKGLLGMNSSKQPPMNSNDGLKKLEENIDMMQKKVAHLESLVEGQEKIIKANVNNPLTKKKALEALRKKKDYEAKIRQTESTLSSLETQKDVLENAKTNASIVQTMAQTAKILKQEHNNMDMGKLEDIVDDIKEQQDIAREITEVIANTGARKEHDDEELLKELEDMGQQQLDEQLLQTDVLPEALPSIPKTVPAMPATSSTVTKKADDELEALKEWAS